MPLNSLHSQWLPQSVPSDVGILLSVDFSDLQNGTAGGWLFSPNPVGRAIYTTNSGNTWLLSQIPDSTRAIVTIQFLKSSTGYGAGAHNSWKQKIRTQFYQSIDFTKLLYYTSLKALPIKDGGDYKGYFLKTTDTGRNWFSYAVLPDSIYYLEGLYFLDLNTGFVTGDLTIHTFDERASVLKTSNGGINWTLLSIPDSIALLRNTYFINSNTGFAVGYSRLNDPVFPIQGVIIRTTNAGTSWTKDVFYYVNNFTDVYFPNSSTGFAVGVSNEFQGFTGIIYKTTNSGLTWNKLDFEIQLSLFEGVKFVSNTGTGILYGMKYRIDTSFYVQEKTLISKTTDYGSSWFTSYLSDSENVYVGNTFADSISWYICGGNIISQAVMLHTTNAGGPIGIQPVINQIPGSFQLYQNHPNPFNPITRIKFDLPSPGIVRMSISDILGREVATLVNEKLLPVSMRFHGIPRSIPAGYIFILSQQAITKSQKNSFF